MDLALDTTDITRFFGLGALERLMSRNGFDRAVERMAQQALLNYKGNWLLSRLLNDRGRYSASLLVLDLHFNANAGRGMTAAELRSETVAWEICSAGRATAFLAALRFGKFVRELPTSDRRASRFGPTDVFLAAHRLRWSNIFQAVQAFDPDLAERGLSAPDSLIFGPGLKCIANHLRGGVRPFCAMPVICDFADREGGFGMLVSLFVLKEGEVLTPRAAGERFSISRTHAATLLRKAVRDGLARAVPEGFVAGPLLMPSLRSLFGMVFLIFEQASTARQAVPQGRCASA